MLQSIGMTGRQLKAMLICEGLFYALGAVLVSLILSVASIPLLSSSMGSMFWFITYKFTIWPVFLVSPIFALLGIILPLTVYRFVSRHSIVERLRETE
jgi:putative ABC transport system permease protein